MWKLKRIVPSEKNNKKWDAIFYDSETKDTKKISFGASGYRDFTLIQDKEEALKARANYWRRHKKEIGVAEPMSPAYLSLFVLWGKYQSVERNMRWYKRLFEL